MDDVTIKKILFVHFMKQTDNIFLRVSVYKQITELTKMQTTSNPSFLAKSVALVKTINVSTPRGALGVTSIRRSCSMSGALEKYISSTSLNIFFFSMIRLFTRTTDGVLVVQSHWDRNIGNTLGCASCATFLLLPHLTSSVIYHETEARQHGIYLLIA